MTLPTYTLFIDFALLLGLALLAWRGHRDRRRALRWLDAGLAGMVGGVIGARALHVALHWGYFRAHTDQIFRLWAGGLSWHGALFGALLAGGLAARRLKVSPADTLAAIFPAGAALGWMGCLSANLSYGQEVRTLADHPPLVAAELPDIYGMVAPRYNTQLFGLAWSVLTLALVGLLARRGWLRGRRLWAALAFYSVGNMLIAGLRADPTPLAGGVRLDQWLDLGIAAASLAALVLPSGKFLV